MLPTLKAPFFQTLPATPALLAALIVSSFHCGCFAQPSETFGLRDTVELRFEGPATSESSPTNPFTEYRLLVTFSQGDFSQTIRGFYAADGNAAETGADSGNVWMVRYTPERLGQWTYAASLKTGTMIAIDEDPNSGASVSLSHARGAFSVAKQTATGKDFRTRGRLIASGGHFRFLDSESRFIKGGAGSPENFLAYEDFDGTRRQSAADREGESKTSTALHRYPNHLDDWNEGDPTWRGGKGKAIVGAVNYLAAMGMNSVYFLTLNINGDGKDVWPYTGYDERERFDCSKLDQWQIVFSHMQRRGIFLHVVTQETENEMLLDNGDTGPQRKLYYNELIARFGHNLGLAWDLGEENGPADFSPIGQNTAQRQAMARHLKANDPYNHPVQLHTHATKEAKEHILADLLGFAPLDGLSFQVNLRETVHDEVIKWRQRAKDAGRDWLISMDEIGVWQDGAVPDSVDPTHDALRHHVLWGSLLAGGAGVEWYFGAKHPHNDLSSEDWRQRDTLWHQTRHAIEFFEAHLPYWKMAPADSLTARDDDYCLALEGETYALYLPKLAPTALDLGKHERAFEVLWLDPVSGGALQTGSVARIKGPGIQDLGAPPFGKYQDWVALVRQAGG